MNLRSPKKFMGVRIVILILILNYGSTKQLSAQPPDSVINYIDTAINLMQAKSLFSKSLDWKKLRDTALIKSKIAKNYKEAFPAIAYVFSQLKDYHGIVANEDTFYRYPAPVNFDEVLSPGIKKAFLKGPRIVTAYFDNSIAYLRIPGMNVTRQQDIDSKANMLRDSLCKLLDQNPKGIIIDLRMNTGGNSAPMISGIGPLFNSTLLGYGVDKNDKFLEPVRLQDAVLLDEKGNKSINIKNNCVVNNQVPIAVLIGPSTVSSGEILALYLKQQLNVKSFGEPTPGFCNATEGFPFANGQGYLLLSVNKIADGNKKVYKEMLVRPDIYVKSEDNYEDLQLDPTVKAALLWLNRKIKH